MKIIKWVAIAAICAILCTALYYSIPRYGTFESRVLAKLEGVTVEKIGLVSDNLTFDSDDFLSPEQSAALLERLKPMPLKQYYSRREDRPQVAQIILSGMFRGYVAGIKTTESVYLHLYVYDERTFSISSYDYMRASLFRVTKGYTLSDFGIDLP